jgi:hypothetical protein
MVRFAIVEREFGSGLDRVQGIKLCPFTYNAHKGIGCAGMVDEPESCCLCCPIDRLPIIHFDDGNPLLDFGAPSSFSLRNAFPFILSDFLSGSQWHFGE